MNVSVAKENILKKIRKALSTSTPLPFPQSEGQSNLYQPQADELEMIFADEFTKLKGKFVFCLDAAELALRLSELCSAMGWTKLFYDRHDQELIMLLKNSFAWFNASEDIAGCDAAITRCESLVARTGSIVLSSGDSGSRTESVYAPVHICIARTSQLVYDIKDALVKVKEKYPGRLPSLITFASGPSRTADIEKTLVVGVHGPKEVYCFLLDG